VRSSRRREIVPRERAFRIRDAFLAALADGDLAALQRLLTEDVLLMSDGGGKVPAAIKPLVGPDRVGRFLVGAAIKGRALIRHVFPATINAAPGFVALTDDGVVQTLALEIDGDRISAIYATRNPDKLRRVDAQFTP
jgi:RNA polymerase sigma-70 factor (ECF subfamily)